MAWFMKHKQHNHCKATIHEAMVRSESTGQSEYERYRQFGFLHELSVQNA